MRILGAAIVVVSLVVTNAFAATTLPAGKPAGVKKAQDMDRNAILIIGGIGLAGLGIGLAASQNGGGPTTVTTATVGTTSTSP
ncbi:MAG TPA: hypothetical protein VH189_08580 [Rhizomicrobium sp.]|nr:hypothetical protein [Rhizomicrobium sp.]